MRLKIVISTRSLLTIGIVLCLLGFSNGLEKVGIDEAIASAAKSSKAFSFFFYDHGKPEVRVEYDIIYSLERYRELQKLNASRILKRNTRKDTRYRWTSKIIPYEILGRFTWNERSLITASMNDYHRYTCLRLRPATSRDRNKIRIQDGSGCSSFVGMQGGPQKVTLAKNCRNKRIILHELGHAIGFYHEQSRPDRDQYVSIYLNNVLANKRHNFRKYNWNVINTYGVPYDYYSVMHYSRKAFSYNGRDTVVPKNSRYLNVIGRVQGLSFIDIKLVNLMYNCAARCGSKKCPGNGFVGQDCKCYCPGNPVKLCPGVVGTCRDYNKICPYWARIGQCQRNPTYMLVNCKKSCNKCSGSVACTDYNKNCAYWARIGQCVRNPTYMLVNCKKSCNRCSGNVDYNTNCAYWARIGECVRYPKFMLVNCKKSCNKCSGTVACRDYNTNCAFLARIGQCQRNPKYMFVNCKKSCHKCSGTVGICRDYKTTCSYLARLGYCTKSQVYMSRYCKKSCNKCGGVGVTCRDYKTMCSYWARLGHCTKSQVYMSRYCKKSCNKCGGVGVICRDTNKNCYQWARLGHCTTSHVYMSRYCKKSCNKCGGVGGWLTSVRKDLNREYDLN